MKKLFIITTSALLISLLAISKYSKEGLSVPRMEKDRVRSSFEYDFLKVPDEALDEFHRQAELWLEGTIKIAIAADGRATTSTGILSAATGAMLVLAANLGVAEHPHIALLYSVVTASGFLLTGASFCIRAAKPIDFYVSGYEPRLLYPVAVDAAHIKRISAANIQERINANTSALETAATKLKRGQGIAAMALPAFILCLFLLSHRQAISAFL